MEGELYHMLCWTFARNYASTSNPTVEYELWCEVCGAVSKGKCWSEEWRDVIDHIHDLHKMICP